MMQYEKYNQYSREVQNYLKEQKKYFGFDKGLDVEVKLVPSKYAKRYRIAREGFINSDEGTLTPVALLKGYKAGPNATALPDFQRVEFIDGLLTIRKDQAYSEQMLNYLLLSGERHFPDDQERPSFVAQSPSGAKYYIVNAEKEMHDAASQRLAEAKATILVSEMDNSGHRMVAAAMDFSKDLGVQWGAMAANFHAKPAAVLQDIVSDFAAAYPDFFTDEEGMHELKVRSQCRELMRAQMLRFNLESMEVQIQSAKGQWTRVVKAHSENDANWRADAVEKFLAEKATLLADSFKHWEENKPKKRK